MNPPKAEGEDSAAAALMQKLSFVVPTEHVELPSKGMFYPEGHPLYQKDTIEIKYMTAKDEDTLTSKNLIKKGIAIERLLQDLILDKSITLNSLLVGDKNAILVSARATAYGSDYQTKITCPSCGKVQTYNFDLNNCGIYHGASDEQMNENNIEKTERGTFVFNLPILDCPAEIRLLSGKEEQYLIQKAKEAEQNKNSNDSVTSDQLKVIIVSINGVDDPKLLSQAIPILPAKDSRYIRDIYQLINPNVDLSHEFNCSACSYEARLEVPFTADFFWPKR
jgi:hypothetical protein